MKRMKEVIKALAIFLACILLHVSVMADALVLDGVPLKITKGEYLFEQREKAAEGETAYRVYSRYLPKGADRSFEDYGLDISKGPAFYWDAGHSSVASPTGIACRGEDIIVSNAKTDCLHRLSLAGKTLERIGGPGTENLAFYQPGALAWDAKAKELYVLDRGNFRIQILDEDLNFLESIQLPKKEAGDDYASMALGPQGKIYVSRFFSGLDEDGIYQIDRKTGEVIGLGHLIGPVFSLGDEVYAAQAKAVKFFDPSTKASHATLVDAGHLYRLTDGKRELLGSFPRRECATAAYGGKDEIFFIGVFDTVETFTIEAEGFKHQRSLGPRLSRQGEGLLSFPHLSIAAGQEKIYVASSEQGRIYVLTDEE